MDLYQANKIKKEYLSLTSICTKHNLKSTSYMYRCWLSNKDTLSFLNKWEQVHNPLYNSTKYRELSRALPDKINLKQWLQSTNAIGIHYLYARDVCAHPTIAEHFEAWCIGYTPREFHSWDYVFKTAVKYHKQHGHLLLQKRTEFEGVKLYDWIRTQRERKAEGKLSDEKIRLLNDLNMVWDYRPFHQERMFNELKLYHKQHGNINVCQDTMVSFPDGQFNLYGWLLHKRNYRNTLKNEQIEQLESLNIVWNQSEIKWKEDWERGFCHAENYYRKNGHLRVQEVYKNESGYQLGTWIRAQRCKYKEGKLTKKQIQLLESIAMLWQANEQIQTSFNEQALFYYMCMLDPKTLNRDSSHIGCELDVYIPSINVGIEYDGPRYHDLQRDNMKNIKCRDKIFLIRVRDYRLPIIGKSDKHIYYLRLMEDNNIQPAIVTILELLHQQFGICVQHIKVDIEKDKQNIYDQMAAYVDSLWNGKLGDIKNYYDNYGNIDVPYGYYVNGYNLGSWIAEQRKSYRLRRLPQHKIYALEELGIKWKYKEDVWTLNYEMIQEYYLLHGHIKITKGETEKSRNLYWWLNDQLKYYRSGKLSENRIRLLEEVGMIWGDKLDLRFAEMCDRLQQFKQDHNHCIVPLDYQRDNDMPLGLWCQRIRLQMKAGKLSKSRCEKLRNIGLHTDNKEAKFYRWLKLASEYKDEYGNLLVSQACIYKDKKLGKWINSIRVSYMKGQLTYEKINCLNEIGMIWRVMPVSGQAMEVDCHFHPCCLLGNIPDPPGNPVLDCR